MRNWLKFSMLALWLAVAGSSVMLPSFAHAEAGPEDAGDQECTMSPAFNSNTTGILTNVLDNVTKIVKEAHSQLYTGIIESPAFMNAIYAAMVLYIVVYGIMFLLGMANLTLGEVVIRTVKIGFILTIISPLGLQFFNGFVYNFFENGTLEIIDAMTQIMAGVTPDGASSQKGVMQGLDRTLNSVFSMHMFVSVLGAGRLLPYGPIFVLLIGYGIWQFLRAIFEAVWVYLMSMIGRALLFGLAPIFIACLMFQKTKTLFDGWLNQIINFCLQPIFLFAFLGFYVTLIEKSLKAILKVQWCWGDVADASGSGGTEKGWVSVIDGTLVRYIWGAQGPRMIDANGKVLQDKVLDQIFPLNIIDVLIFCLLAQLAWRYTQVVVSIAREIAGSAVSMANTSGALTGWFQNAEAKAGAGAQGYLKGAKFGSGGARIDSVGGIKGMKEAMKAVPPRRNG